MGSGAHPAISIGVTSRIRSWMRSARTRMEGRPRIITAAITLMVIGLAVAIGGAVWFVRDLTAGLPDAKEIHGLGDMAQATTIFDARDVPGLHHLQGTADRGARSTRCRPNLVKAVIVGRGPALLRSLRRRRHPHRRRRAAQRSRRAPRRGRQHDHPAACAPEFPDTRQDLSPQAEGSDPRRAHRARVHQARDPRDVPEQGLLRRRPLRRRGGVARLLRQARQRR